MRKGLLLCGMALVVLVAACAGPSAPKPDFDTCQGFLEVTEVAPVAGGESLTVERRSVTSTAQAQVPAIQGYCQVSFLTQDSLRAIALDVIRYTSPEVAQETYQRLREGLARLPNERATEGVMGENSYQVVVNARGVGSFVILRQGAYLVQLHTAVPTEQQPLAPVEGLRQLARLVRERLP